MKQISLNEYKKVILNILVKVDQICRENNINYFLFAGTLLGAVRHKGFIPWDDDIDISMMREDYNQLAKVIQNGDYGLNFIRIEEHVDCIYPYGKICDKNTVLIEKNFKTVEGYGAFIDVFPFDYMPDSDEEMRKLSKKWFRKYQFLTHCARTGYEKNQSTSTNLKRTLAFALTRCFDSGKIVINMNEAFKNMNGRITKHVGLAWWKCAWLAEDYSETSEVDFEGYRFLAPKDPDRVLKTHFGDYMKLPSKDQRVLKHQLECYYRD